MWLGRQPRKPVEDVRLGRIVSGYTFQTPLVSSWPRTELIGVVANDVGKKDKKLPNAS